jgi:head-tail adaptor
MAYNPRTIRAGELRHRITINGITRGTPLATGEKPMIETSIATVWAKVESLSGRMGEIAKGMYPTATDRIEMRYFPNLTITNNSVVFGTRRFAINNINDVDNIHKKMILTVTETLKPMTENTVSA